MPLAIIVFISLCGLLVAGKFARLRMPLLQRLYLPSSIIGGAIGLAVLSALGDRVDPEITGAMRKVPGFLINVVFATGVTATGLMLLRTVDPDSKTCAAVSFGYKQLLHEPFMGGGLWTAFAFTLVVEHGWLPVFLFSCVMLALWIACSFFRIRLEVPHFSGPENRHARG